MRKGKDKIIVMAPEASTVRITTTVIGVLWFCALFLLFVPKPHTACAATVLTGAAFAAAWLVFGGNKWVRRGMLIVAVVFTALAVGVGFDLFRDGLFTYWNKTAYAVNLSMHRGWRGVLGVSTEGGCALVLSAVSVWLGIGIAALVERSCIMALGGGVIIFIALLFVGLVPPYYVVVWWTLAAVGLLLVDRRFPVKTAALCLAAAAVVFAAIIPCFLYGGSRSLRTFRANVVRTFESVMYGSDSLPEGRLYKASGMCDDDETRLIVTFDEDVKKLYLKGFVGSTLDGNVWLETDKNAYVENDRQGIMEYLAVENLPFGQFAAYDMLNGVNFAYTVRVENVGASRKYVYTPYAAQDVSVGSAYYDLQMRGGIRTERTYTFDVLRGDDGYERLEQSAWVSDPENRIEQRTDYLDREAHYRALVYDLYASVGAGDMALIDAAVGGWSVSSISTATQVIRAYFLKDFIYSEHADSVGDDFSSAFFGGEITHANSAYFASAATLMFRYFGYAARYAEGYLAVDDGSGAPLYVTSRDAHAWTEVYFDGMGWLPIEVSPSFFSDEQPNTVVDPILPDDTSSDHSSESPDVQTPDPEESPEPVDPIVNSAQTEESKKSDLELPLRVLIPIVAVLAAFAIAVLAVVARREYILSKKRKALNSGAESGRVAYRIVDSDCKPFGGFDVDKLTERGVDSVRSNRFIQLVERNVYGGYALTEYEREFIEEYIESVASAILNSAGKRKLYHKYIRCVGL
ncbi:MAG: transglutaminase-like domain-containing protein [Roseburia sp.]|nr:transglutaminase-like domain-containing protein [Roseburia sp.]